MAKDLREKVEEFSKEYARLADPIWERDYKKAYEGGNKYVTEMRKKFEDQSIAEL